jgi:hypothetical protein
MERDANDDGSEEPTIDDVEHQAADSLSERRDGVLGAADAPAEHVRHASEEADDQQQPERDDHDAVDVAGNPAEAARRSEAADRQQGSIERGEYGQLVGQEGQDRTAEHDDDQRVVLAAQRVLGLSQQSQEEQADHDGYTGPDQERCRAEHVECHC